MKSYVFSVDTVCVEVSVVICCCINLFSRDSAIFLIEILEILEIRYYVLEL